MILDLAVLLAGAIGFACTLVLLVASALYAVAPLPPGVR
jgi:UPF0716 family protein affecting phage T7 exclusion